MSFMQVFKKPGQKAYSYLMQAGSQGEAARIGAELATENPEQWGNFCYSRPAGMLEIRLNEFYHLQPTQLHLRYRKEGEELNGPLDYLHYVGPHIADIGFPLTWQDPASGGTVRLTAWFDAAKAFKFKTLCESHRAKFVLKDGHPVLQFYRPFADSLVGEIQLQRKN
jgi:hypothetical protein